MTSEQEELAKGRILTQYLEAKKQLVTLHAEAAKISNLFSSIAQTFKQGSYGATNLEAQLNTLPTREEIKELVADIRETTKRRQEAQKNLQELGVDLLK